MSDKGMVDLLTVSSHGYLISHHSRGGSHNPDNSPQFMKSANPVTDKGKRMRSA